MRIELQMKGVQTITPQMIATMTILQYGTQELTEYLRDLSYENPMVELKESQPEESAPHFADKLNWLRRNDRPNRSYYADEDESRQAQLSAPEDTSLGAFLREQLLSIDLPRPQAKAAQVLISALDDHGFWDGDLEEIAALAGSSTEDAEIALGVLRTLEPVGVGARDLTECLLMQLRDYDAPLAETLVRNHLKDLCSKSPRRLAEMLGVTEQELSEAQALIATLQPYPAAGFSGGEGTVYIRPDLYISLENGALSVRTNESELPTISVNPQYLTMLESETDPQVQQYLRQKLQQVEQVVKNMGIRTSTMERCGQFIAETQSDYFFGGALKDLTLREAAEALDVHESTVSRAIKNKYIQCSRGVLPMKFFFSRNVGGSFGLSRTSAKDAVSQLIGQEDPAAPLSDEKVASILASRQIKLSRRTVAKYRMELGILPAAARKRA